MELGGLLALQGALCLRLAPRVKEELESAQRLGSQTAILREGLQSISGNHFNAALLQDLQRNAEDKDRALAKLQREVMLVEQRVKEWYYVPSLLLAVGTETALCLDAWKRRHRADMQRWLNVWGEFEALLALSTYAAEHPENVYPEIEDHNPDGSALLVVRGAKHPLLNPDEAVANDIVLGMTQDSAPAVQILMISGSNMAGKSTLLRTLGTNVVLALAGVPIPATEARLCVFRLAASIAVNDSLAEGKSKFLAEVERLRAMVTLAQENHGRTLFLIDEIFSGTNSLDRRVATEPVIRVLVEAGAVGAISTHDLTLTEIAELPNLHGRNIHMASPAEDDPLAFDYLIKPGVNRTTNGLAIVRMLGLLN
jgi:DNA mismatch repair ATPase MutS